MQENIESGDAQLEKVVMFLLKLHSAFAAVDEPLTNRLLEMLVAGALLLTVMVWAVSWYLTHDGFCRNK